MAVIRRDDITGLVLAGGRGSRMGGVDKGLQLHRGVPLALHAIRRLSPQVGSVMVNANRHFDGYAAFGVPVCRDAAGDGGPSGEPPAYAGPLAGFLAGLQRCSTPYLATVPCDSPNFPLDLVARLAAALAAQRADVAIASTPAVSRSAGGPAGGRSGGRAQPVFCLMRTGVVDGLLRFLLDGGDRRVGRWAAAQHCVEVPFADAAAFVNANTLDELARLQPAPSAAA